MKIVKAIALTLKAIETKTKQIEDGRFLNTQGSIPEFIESMEISSDNGKALTNINKRILN